MPIARLESRSVGSSLAVMPRRSDNICACSTIQPHHIGDRYRIAQVMESGVHSAPTPLPPTVRVHWKRSEFKRYFDLGVFLEKEHWILDTFGKAEGEGLRFVRSELAYLRDQGLSHLVPASIARVGAKWLGYRLGQVHRSLPRSIMKRLSMHST